MSFTPYVVGDRDYFDSQIDTMRCSPTRNADFYLIVRAELVPYRPRAGTETIGTGDSAYSVCNWSPGELASFGRTFKSLVETHFNGQLYMVPSRQWGYECTTRQDHNFRFIPNLKLSVRVQLVEAGQNPHLRVKCFRLTDGQQFHTSFVARSRARQDFRMELDHLDVRWRTDIHQIACVHEFGHYLGLGHVNNPYCVLNGIDTNTGICYGGTAHQSQDLMGSGMRIEEWHAGPWTQRIRQHLDPGENRRLTRTLGALTWSVVPKARRPVPQRIYAGPSISLPPAGARW